MLPILILSELIPVSLTLIKRLGIFLLPPEWDASPSQGTLPPPPPPPASTHLYTWVKRGTIRVRTQHSDPGRGSNWAARSGVQRTNHKRRTIRKVRGRVGKNQTRIHARENAKKNKGEGERQCKNSCRRKDLTNH